MNPATLRQLLWTCLLLLTVNVEARTKVSPEEKSGPWVNPNYELCEQIQCLRVEDVFLTAVDNWENPCDDYVKYACHRTYNGSSDHAPFSRDSNEVIEDLKNILDEDIVRELDKGNHALAIEKKIFKLCKNGVAFSHQDKQYYVQTVLPSTHANRLLPENEYRPDQTKWDQADLNYALKGFGFAFFDVDVYERIEQDSYGNVRSKRYVLIKPPSHDIFGLQHLLDERFVREARRDNFYSRNKYEKLNDFLRRLAITITASQAHVSQKPTDLTFRSISQWQRDYDNHAYHANAQIDWLNYLSKLFGKVRIGVHADTTIAIQRQDYFFQLARDLQETKEIDAIVDYVHLHFVSKSIGLADSDYREYSILPQIKGLPCTPGLLIGTAYRYADENFSEENRRLLENLILRVKDAVIARVERAMVNTTDYPSDPLGVQQSMNNFIQEYRDVQIHAGYPNWLMNGTTAYSIYGVQTAYPSSRFYDNQAYLIEQLLVAKLSALTKLDMPIFDPRELRKAFESSEIEIHSKTIDGSLKVTKEIVVPFGYFNEKDYRFFSSQLYDPINYGAAATEIAFVLYSDLLSRIFKDRIGYYDVYPKCIRDQVPSHVRDRDTFAKNAVAYLLALDAAYESWPSKNFYPIQFVDFGAVTDGDLFFLSFAESLCSVPPRENQAINPSAYLVENKKVSYRSNDREALSHYINFALQNSRPYTENYMCQSNQKMYSDGQCDPLRFNVTHL